MVFWVRAKGFSADGVEKKVVMRSGRGELGLVLVPVCYGSQFISMVLAVLWPWKLVDVGSGHW